MSASKWLQNEYRKLDFSYRSLTSIERDESLIQTVSALLSELPTAGVHRQNDWESGWGQNLEDLERNSDETSIIPRYFNKFNLVRWRQELIAPVHKNMEHQMLGFILDWISDEFLADFSNIYEFGAGTGHNLLRFRKRNDSATLWGLDWARSSQNIIQRIAERREDSNIRASYFDYFNPDERLMNYYDHTNKCFKIQMKNGESFDLHLPTLGIMNFIKNYIKTKQQTNKNFDKAFIKYAPFLFPEWKTLTQASYDKAVQESMTWSLHRISVLDKLVEILSSSVNPQIRYMSSTGGERVSPLNFPGGVKSIFLISDIFGELV